MKILLLSLLVAIIQGDAVNPRSINLNLDTSLVVDHGDEDKTTFLEKVKKVFDKIREFFDTLDVEEIISKKKEKIKEDIKDIKDGYLKNFFKNIGNTALQYDNDILKDLTQYVADEVSQIVDQNDEFSDIDFKKSFEKKKKLFLSMKIKKIKSLIKQALKTKHERLIRLEDKFREFYDERDRAKLRRINSRFDEKPDSRKRLKKIVKDVFNVLFYEKYDELDKVERGIFTKAIKDLVSFVDIEIETRRKNDYKSDSDDLEDSDNATLKEGNSKELNKISFKKDIEIVMDGKDSEGAE